ncbi:MAG: hypothetical protein M3387_07205 [Actinomycetota bacterium]|nr:hypothetical protein [Actinomycetota bacterium]
MAARRVAAHRMLAVGLVATALGGCGTAGTGQGVAGITPRNGRSGLSLSGTVEGRQIAINDGAPRMRIDDCDPNQGPDTDLCFFSRDIDGSFFGLIVENPDALVGGQALPVAAELCAPRACDELSEVAVVEVQLGVGTPRVRAEGGQLRMTTVEPRRRYAGSLTLELPDGRLAGTFDVVPRPPE